MHNEIQNNKLQILGKLAASLVHEIRNPLSAVRLNIEYLDMEKDKLTDDMLESVQSCKEAIERINYLIDNVLEFSRRGFTDHDRHSLNDVIANGLGIMHPFADTKAVELKTELFEDIPHFEFNKNKVLQVVINLITNAIEASQKGGHVCVRTKFVDDGNGTPFVLLEVNDQGHGIEKASQDKIFHDFFTSKHKGTGLGLSVCKSIVEEHEGEIYFISKPGEGSTFFVKFPFHSLSKGDAAQ